MAITELIFGEKQRVTLGRNAPLGPGVLQFDAAIEETYLDEVEITSHPVEEGADITDHMRKLPATYEVTGRITNTPIVLLASLRATSPVKTGFDAPSLPVQTDRVSDGYDFLRQLMDQGITVNIATSLRDYDTDMALTSLTVRRNYETGQVLDCTLALQEILKARALSVDLPIPKEVQNKKKKNKGNKDKKGASAKQGEKSKSILSKLVGLFGG